MRLRPLAAAVLLSALAAVASAQSLTLSADAISAPYHTVIHFTAAATAATAAITFADNGIPILSLPANAQGTAVLGIATLTPGPHTLTAATGSQSSNPVTLTVTPLPATVQLTSDSPTYLDQSTIRLNLAGLPPQATGTVTYSDNATPFAATTLNPVPSATYQAFGDSITSGYTLAQSSDRYADLFAVANQFPAYPNYAQPSAIACDVLAYYILPNQLGPTEDAAPLTSVMIGSTDVDRFGVPAGEPNFTSCHLAALAWLSIPREYKIFPGDSAVTLLSGAWQLPPQQLDSTYATLYNPTGQGAASFQITSNGGPLYLWYLLGDHLTGAFTVSVDGIPTGTTYTTNPATPIASLNNPDSTGFALLRLPVAAGHHTLRVDIVSGTVGLLAAATPPSPGAASVHPTVFAADIPNQNAAMPAASPAAIAQFSSDALADAALLAADGLDIRPLPTHAYLTGDPAEFTDFAHPSILGHQHLAAAFQAAFAATSIAPYLVYPAGTLTQSLRADPLGQHNLAALYSGDPLYTASAASVSLDVVPTGHSVTTLAATATTFTVGQPVAATATIFPANPGSTVYLLEGQEVLAAAPIASATGTFSLASLTPGIHTLHAGYPGDAQNSSSVSPPLSVKVLQNSTTLVLTNPVAELPYSSNLTLSAATLPAAASGTILFSDNYTPGGQAAQSTTQQLGQATLADGTTSFVLPALAPGTHTFTAVYTGDTNDSTATSAPTVTRIDTIPTVTTLAAAPGIVKHPSTFTATISAPASPYPVTGTVTFTDSLSPTPIQVAVSNGIAIWTTDTLTPGTHILTAAYSGDPNHGASVIPSLAVTIARDPAAVTLTLPQPAPYTGSPILLSASVDPITATGSVLFAATLPGASSQAAPGQIILGQAQLAY